MNLEKNPWCKMRTNNKLDLPMAPSQNRTWATLLVEGEYSPIPDMCKPTTNLTMIVCIIPYY